MEQSTQSPSVNTSAKAEACDRSNVIRLHEKMARAKMQLELLLEVKKRNIVLPEVESIVVSSQKNRKSMNHVKRSEKTG